MQKISAGQNVFIYPMPVTLLGTVVEGKPNFMALGWVSRVNANPPMIGCGVGKHHHTVKGILENSTFSVNIPTAAMVKDVDYCGIVSGKDTDKASRFHVFSGSLGNAPMIEECSLCMECRLTNVIENPTNTFYIGEIVASYTEEKYLSGGKPDIVKMNPLLLTMPDNRYWTVGEYKGDAWSIGKTAKTGE